LDNEVSDTITYSAEFITHGIFNMKEQTSHLNNIAV